MGRLEELAPGRATTEVKMRSQSTVKVILVPLSVKIVLYYFLFTDHSNTIDNSCTTVLKHLVNKECLLIGGVC